jgi:lipoprotein-anchoring transpeptidase ErfK/SrfK
VSRRRIAVALGATAAACAVVVVLLVSGGRDEPARRPATKPPPRGELPGLPPQVAGRPVRGPYGAQLVRRTQLRARPGGRVVRALGIRTGYGSARVLSVAGRRGRWLAVLSDHMANSRVGWIPVENVTLLHEPYTLHVDLSARELVVHHEGRRVRRITVAVGRPGTTTPTGRFAVTDLLKIDGGHAAYGCCALALTGRQPNVPQGWSGGDRIAIHGTSNEATLGTPASSGCLRASDHDMRWLLARVALGTPVQIRA